MKRYRRLFAVSVAAAFASLALLASAAQAAPPAPPYEDFAGCPSVEENSFVGGCLKVTFTGGHVELGKRDVPISNPITLRGGFEGITGDFIANSEGGMLPAKQPVPGGVFGLTGYKWLDELFSHEQLKLFATFELAGQPGSVFEPDLTLPVKVHLESPVLGKKCYVGSNANPIQLVLTTGTTNPPPPNGPISGTPAGELAPEPGREEVLTSTEDGTFVDNAYAVPGANGCKLKVGQFELPFSIDNAINNINGLPAPAGTNTAELDFAQSIVSPEVVYP